MPYFTGFYALQKITQPLQSVINDFKTADFYNGSKVTNSIFLAFLSHCPIIKGLRAKCDF